MSNESRIKKLENNLNTANQLVMAHENDIRELRLKLDILFEIVGDRKGDKKCR